MISNNFPIKCFIVIDLDGNMLCWNFSKWLSLRKDAADNACRRVVAVKRVERTALPGCTRRLGLVGLSTGSLPWSGPVLLPISKSVLYLMSTRALMFHKKAILDQIKDRPSALFCV